MASNIGALFVCIHLFETIWVQPNIFIKVVLSHKILLFLNMVVMVLYISEILMFYKIIPKKFEDVSFYILYVFFNQIAAGECFQPLACSQFLYQDLVATICFPSEVFIQISA